MAKEDSELSSKGQYLFGIGMMVVTVSMGSVVNLTIRANKEANPIVLQFAYNLLAAIVFGLILV